MYSPRRTLALFGLLALFSVPAIWPYLGGDPPRTNDLAPHMFRAFELEQLIRSGVFFPRWAPNLVHGYGYPIFNYFSYLSHYLIALIHIAVVNFLWAYRIAALGMTLAAGWGAFQLGREITGSERGGLIAALGYVYSPYLLYTANVRGGLPESLALAILPFALLTWHRAARQGWRYVVPAGIAFGMLVFSHNGIALQVSPLLLAYALWSGRAHLRHTFIQIASATLIGLAMAAFYWLPALTELNFAQIETRFATTGISYALNFTPLRALFDYPALPVDSDLLNPPLLRPLPIVTFLLAIAALTSQWRTRAALQQERIFLAALATGCIFITLPQSAFVWDAIPLLQRTLWPWRYLGPAALFLALLAATLDFSQVPTLQTSSRANALIPLLIVFLFIANALPWLYPPREPIEAPNSLGDLTRYELPPLLIGTSTNAEYLPRWVSKLPDTSTQREALLTDFDPDRLDRVSLPKNARVVHTDNTLYRDHYVVDLLEASTLTFRQFYFPGWQILLDGERIPIRITGSHGLITVDIPAGEHSLVLEFVNTPIRTAADTISILAVTSLGLYFIFRRTRFVARIKTHTFEVISLRTAFLGGLLICMFFGITVLVDSPIRQHGLAAGNRPAGIANALNRDLYGELWLHGYTLSRAAFPADGEIEVDLYWQAQHNLGLSYGFNLRLVDAEERIWNSTGIIRPADWRFAPGTDFWPLKEYVLQSAILRPLPGTPPGAYKLQVVAFRDDILQVLDTVELGEITIATPDRSSYTDTPPQATFADGSLELLVIRLDRGEARPGDPLRIDFVWRAGPEFLARADYTLMLILDEAETQASITFAHTLSAAFGTAQWQAGDVLADQLFNRLPASLPAGQYTLRLWVQKSDGEPLGEFALPQTITVAAIERTFSLPAITEQLAVPLDDGIVLAGYHLESSELALGDTIELELVWQTQGEIDTPYRVFVHLIDSSGQIISQSDVEPVNWTRPTTGWLSEEYIQDRHSLSIPAEAIPGRYSIRAGMYAPHSGQRLLSTAYPDGSIPLATIAISGS